MKLNKRMAAVVIFVGLLIGGLVGGVLLTGEVGSASAAQGSGENDDANEGPDVPITGDALDRASTAALDYIGGGRVTETEVGDEEGYYEIEITLDGGGQTDVHLDENFNVLGQEVEGNESDD